MKNPKVCIRPIFDALKLRPESPSQKPLEEQGRFRFYCNVWFVIAADCYGSQFRSLKHVSEEWSKRDS